MSRSILLLVCAFSLLALNNVTAGTVSQNLVPLPSHPEGKPWPTAGWTTGLLSTEIDEGELEKAIKRLFEPQSEKGVPDTRAVLIVRGGEVVFEKYAEGFDSNTRFHSWSVAKSFTNALVGMLVAQGKLDLEQKGLMDEWEGDVRIKISLKQMLNMTSGLNNGDQREDNFVGDALFGSGAVDVNQAIVEEALIHDPGKHWAYSTATSTLLANVAGKLMGEDKRARQAYAIEHLLGPIGAADVVMTYDKAGYFFGGSHVYATAREYAKFGYLYLRDGIWDGKRILPAGWVDFSRTPAPAENNGNHGAHFWLNTEGKDWQPKMLPGGPESVFLMSGNEGQYIYIIPSHDMMLVRLGKMHTVSWAELTESLASVVAIFPPMSPTSNSAEVAQ